MRLTVSNYLLEQRWGEADASVSPRDCVLSCYDLHPFHQTDFNLFKNRNSELIINLTIYFPIMLIVVKLNVAIKSLQLILSINFSEDIENMYVYSCFRTEPKMMHVFKTALQNRTAF